MASTRQVIICLVICGLFFPLLSSEGLACIPEDADRSAQVVFNNGEQVHLSVLIAAGTEDIEYFVEKTEVEDRIDTLLVYRSSFNPQAMVKVGKALPLKWPSLLVVLPQDMDAEAFDFTAAIKQELHNLLNIGALSNFSEDQLAAVTEKVHRAGRVFTKQKLWLDMGCISADPLECVDCTRPASFTRLPSGQLFGGTTVQPSMWGRIKQMFVGLHKKVW